jgi:hypothetical protein
MRSLNRLFTSRNRADLVPPRLRRREPGPGSAVIVHHYCPHTFNAGDHFVVRSIREHLRRHLPQAVFVPKAVARNRGWGGPIGLRGENIRESNAHADAVILGGSDQYHDWAPRITAGEIVHLAPPLFLVGLGVSSADLGAPPTLGKAAYREDILAANTHASLSSVRDDVTAAFLRDLGFDGAVVTGCPALYLEDRPLAVRDEGPVLLTFPYPLARSETAAGKYAVLLDALRRLLDRLDAAGERAVVVCHDDRDVAPAQEHFPGRPLFFSNYVDDYLPLVSGAKAVIGSRLHAAILALGMGVPAININLDLRGTGFSETFGLGGWNVDYTAPGLGDALWERFETVRAGSLDGFSAFAEQKERYRAVFERFMADTAARIRDAAGVEA